MSSIKVKTIILATMVPGAQATVRAHTVAGASRYSIIAASVLLMGTSLCTCIEPITAIQAARFEAAHPNIAGACVYFGKIHAALTLKVYGTWVYSINSAASPAAATHVFSTRVIGEHRVLVLMPQVAVAVGTEITCFYHW